MLERSSCSFSASLIDESMVIFSKFSLELSSEMSMGLADLPGLAPVLKEVDGLSFGSETILVSVLSRDCFGSSSSKLDELYDR